MFVVVAVAHATAHQPRLRLHSLQWASARRPQATPLAFHSVDLQQKQTLIA